MSTTRIIVVEDEAIVAKDLEETLIRLGYEVPAVESTGEQAIEKVALLGPDLILMDIVLDGEMDGIQTAEIIQSRFDIPVVYLTAHADKPTLDRAKKTGPYGYILKPFHERELLSTLEIAIYRDQMEKTIKNLAPWLKAILKGIGDGVIATDEKGIISFINPAAESLTGWNRKEILGLEAVEVLKIEDWETGDPIENLLKETLKSGKITRWNMDAALIDVDGRRHPVEHYCAPIFDDKGNISGGLILIRDAAERKRIQAEKARIQTTVQEMQKLETLGMMAGGIAHEFNSLHTAIIGNTQLARRLTPPDSPTIFNLVHIEQVALRAVALNKKILDYSLKGLTSVKRINLNKIVIDIKELFSWSIGKNIDIHYRLSKDFPTILADPIEIRQIVVNLAINAIEAINTEKGSITISTGVIHEKLATLREFYPAFEVPEGDYVFLEVQDSGCGISDESKTEIFTPFYTTKPKNNGLGLAAVLNVISNNKGAIKVYSECGHGSTFTVIFPTIGEPIIENPVRYDTPENWRASGTVLVVDDEAAVCAVAAEFLRLIGFNAITANNGFDALTRFTENAKGIKVVLLDVYMPGISGKETFRKLRQTDPNVPILMMSPVSETEAVNCFFDREKGTGFLQKPFPFEVFRNKIWELVEHPYEISQAIHKPC